MKKIKENNLKFIIVWKDKTVYAKGYVSVHRSNGKVKVLEEEIRSATFKKVAHVDPDIMVKFTLV